MRFGEYMKQAMEEKNISQAELARRIGLKRSTINGYVSGRRTKIALPILNSIMRALDMDAMKVLQECTELDINMPGYDDIPLTDADMPPEPTDNDLDSAHRRFKMLIAFDTLNETGQQKAVDYVVDLSENPKYTEGN